MKTKEDLNDILEFYRMDERMIRYIDRFHEEFDSGDENSCPNEIMANHFWLAYCEDIGGEGA